jgi:zinc protease
VAQQASIDTPDKEMAAVATGTTVKLRDDNPDFPALEFANYILGQSAKSRLLNRLRHEGGLSYGAGSMMQADSEDEVTVIAGFAICAPQNAIEAQEAMREEFDKWIAKGVTEEELAEGKLGYFKQWEGQLANDEYVSGALLSGLELDRTLEFDAEQMAKIQSLTLEEISGTLQKWLKDTGRFELIAGDMSKVDTGE